MRGSLAFVLLGILALLVIVVALVGGLTSLRLWGSEPPSWVYVLPLVNGVINLGTLVFLVVAYRFIRQGVVDRHHRWMVRALVLTLLFLLSYLTYHFSGAQLRFRTEVQIIQWLYYGILFSHIVCAAVVTPLVLFTFFFGWQGQWVRHRRLARIAYPLWVYTVATGILVSLFLVPVYLERF